MAAKKKQSAARRSGVRDPATEPDAVPADYMSRCAMFCQQGRWREAFQLVLQVEERARKRGDKALLESLSAARGKIEYSLRRQMAAALVRDAARMLRKEFLLDVAEG